MSNVTNWYAENFKSWQAKLLGSKPTAEMLTAIHGLGARPGKQALACAMALRPEGVTGSQIIMACGAPQLNKMRGFITDALLKREPVPPAANGHKVYKLVVTPKGTKRIEAKVAAEAALVAEGEAKAVKAAKRAPGDAVADAVKRAEARAAAKVAKAAKAKAKAAEKAGEAAIAINAAQVAVAQAETIGQPEMTA